MLKSVPEGVDDANVEKDIFDFVCWYAISEDDFGNWKSFAEATRWKKVRRGMDHLYLDETLDHLVVQSMKLAVFGLRKNL